jgi:CBS domain-containing protein
VTGNTGSQWIINNYRNLTQTRSEYQALLNITQGIYNNQWSGKVVSQWPDLDPNMDSENHISTVGHIMTSSTITANYADSAQLTLELMRWNNIHHLPVLDDNSKLVGLVTWSLLDKYKENVNDPNKLLCVEDIMVKEVVTVKRHTPIEEALELMNKYNIGCLPIIDCERLVGIITHRDLERLKHGKNIQ